MDGFTIGQTDLRLIVDALESHVYLLDDKLTGGFADDYEEADIERMAAQQRAAEALRTTLEKTLEKTLE